MGNAYKKVILIGEMHVNNVNFNGRNVCKKIWNLMGEMHVKHVELMGETMYVKMWNLSCEMHIKK